MLIAVTLLLALVAGGCGGSDTSTPTGAAEAGQSSGPPDAKAAAAAEVICTRMIARSSQMGAEFRSGQAPAGDALSLTTQLIKPALPIVEDSARRLRALRAEADSVKFDAYVNLFDPVLALLHERVNAGEAGESIRAHELEQQLVEMIELQRELAQEAGLGTCDVDFIKTFVSSGTAQ
jgi:hypothetical protein